MVDKKLITRRRIIRTIGATGSLSVVPIAATSESAPESDSLAGESLRSVALEAASHPSESAIAFTAITADEGFQLYLARGADTLTDRPNDDDLIRLTDAEAGVHGLHWIRNGLLKYSIDGRTTVRTVRVRSKETGHIRGRERTVSDQPLPITGQHPKGASPGLNSVPDIPFPIDCKPGANVCCTDIPFVSDWCLRVDYDEDPGHIPECTNNNPPVMDHAHVAIFPSGDATKEINIWAGYDGRCTWIGEENLVGKCYPVCAPSPGEVPSVGDLRDVFEDIIEDALDAAGIAAPAVVVVALAYLLAVSTVTPPVPGVPII